MTPQLQRRALVVVAVALGIGLVMVGRRIWMLDREATMLAGELVEARAFASDACERLDQQLLEAITILSSSSPPPQPGGWAKYYSGALIVAFPWFDYCAGDGEQVARARRLQSSTLFLDTEADKPPLLAAFRELRAIIARAPRTP